MMLSRSKVTNYLTQKAKVFRHQYLDTFVFIHINKTGGSSIERALRLPLEHKTALEKIDELGQRRWGNRYTFAVVRNPWDKVVSHYHYRVQTNQTGLATNNIDFKEWVKLAYENKDPSYHDISKMFMPQINWISDLQGNILVDFICRFENLNTDFRHVCTAIGKNVELPHVKASKRGNYREYYDSNTMRVVADWFHRDIDVFGYEF